MAGFNTIDGEIIVKRIKDFADFLGTDPSAFYIALDGESLPEAKRLPISAIFASTAHNDTTGKQGGVTDEYYHLSQDAALASEGLPYQVVADESSRPATGNTSIIYYAKAENAFSYWAGTTYLTIPISGIETVELSLSIAPQSLNDGSYNYVSLQDVNSGVWLANMLRSTSGDNYQLVVADFIISGLDAGGTGNNLSTLKLKLYKNTTDITSSATTVITGSGKTITDLIPALSSNSFTRDDTIELYIDTYSGSDLVPEAMMIFKFEKI